MEFKPINFDDYPKENVEYLKKLLSNSTNRDTWALTVINSSSIQGLSKIEWLKINILLEAFVKYHEEKPISQSKDGNFDFITYMSKAYEISNNIIEIFPAFKFLPTDEYAHFIKDQRESNLPDDLPYMLLNNITYPLDSISKQSCLVYFCEFLAANFDTRINGDNLNEFISEYCDETIQLDWINSLIIDSYLSIIIYLSINLHFQSDPKRIPSLNYYPPKDSNLSALFKILKYRYSGVFKWITLPSISIYLALINKQLASILILWLFGIQITIAYYIKKTNSKIFDFIDIFSKNLEPLIKIKQGLNLSIMHSNYIFNVLTKIDEYKIFNLDNLISFLIVIKNKKINPINRVTNGIMKDIELYKNISY